MRYIIIRGHICACVLAIDLGFVTRRGFCTLCLILVWLCYVRMHWQLMFACINEIALHVRVTCEGGSGGLRFVPAARCLQFNEIT